MAAAARGAEVHEEGHDAGHWVAASSHASPTDLAGAVETESETKIVELIHHHRPDDGIVGQHRVEVRGISGVDWFIDPLDGTRNYYIGYPAHSVSIGVSVDGRPTIGVVHDTARHQRYLGSLEQPAQMNDHALSVKTAVPLDQAILATGFAPIPTYREVQAEVLARVLPEIGDMRRSGSPSLDLCAVAAGRLHGFFEMGLPVWDYAAGRVIVEAAGGAVEVVETAEGWPGPVVAAGHPDLVAAMIEMGHRAGIPLL